MDQLVLAGATPRSQAVTVAWKQMGTSEAREELEPSVRLAACWEGFRAARTKEELSDGWTMVR